MVELADMRLFVEVATGGSLSAAGRILGFSTAAASKRLTRLESLLGVRLVQRTSRRMQLTELGEAYLERCQAILAAVEDAESLITSDGNKISGTLRLSAPVALGRRWIGPALAKFVRVYPDLKIHLSLDDSVVDLVDAGIDCAVRIGHLQDSRLVARKLADNYRVICAAPAYLAERGVPGSPEDLCQHRAISLSAQPGELVQWRLQPAGVAEAEPSLVQQVRVPVRLSTNNGEQAHDWALEGLGLVRRSLWDVADAIAAGALTHVLPHWVSEPAPLHILFPSRLHLPAKTRLFIEFLVDYFQRRQASLGIP